MKSRLYLACILILAVGLCSAALIYATAEEAPVDAVRYVIVDGVAYPIEPQHSKLYIRDLQRYGGKAAVLFDEINRWFDALWHGRALAATIAWISVLLSLAVFLFARYLSSDADG